MPKNSRTYTYGKDQIKYIEEISKIFKEKSKNTNLKAYVKTYGCQQNVSDSEKYKGMLEKMGFSFTQDFKEANIMLFNTCAIRENAENKVFGNVGFLKTFKKENPESIIILAGCMTQQDSIAEKIKNVYGFVDIVLGTSQVHEFPRILFEFLNSSNIKKHTTKIYNKDEQNTILEGFPTKRNGKIKAFVSIMSGCNNFCSYCIVPYVRGRERSRNPKAIINEVLNLLENGYKDITLVGQNVNSYGKDLEGEINFCYLLKKLDELPYDFKLRFMTSHPKDATKELFDVISCGKHISKHIHLPVQCGSNRILKAMNRKYTKEDYIEIINYAKKKIPGVTFTSDIIVGFPGETYEDFLETLNLIKEVKFSSLFTFIYSPREGTPAAKLPDGVSKKEKTDWLLELLKVQENISENLCKNMVGKRERVLAESYENGILSCRTDGNTIVKIKTTENYTGNFLNTEIIDSSKESLIGKLI